MIPAVHPRGTNVGGLLRYLFGPGKREEHARPRLVAAWDGAGDLAALQPPALPGGRHDVRRLSELLEQPVRAGIHRPAKTVWHCSIRTHLTDRILSDDAWGHIVGEVMAAVGLAPHGDPHAVRWVAVRHNDDHVHLVATLVRQDRRTVWPWQDKRKAQAVCRDLEERYNLYRIAPGGVRRWPSPAELNKTARLSGTGPRVGTPIGDNSRSRRTIGTGHRLVPRDDLRHRVRVEAAVAVDESDFFARLATVGVSVRLRYSSRNSGEVSGYAVGLPEHRTAGGDVVWYGGGRLAADLTLPQLRSRWAGTPPPAPVGSAAARLAATGTVPLDVSRRAAGTVRDAMAAMRDAPDLAAASAIASGAADLLSATAGAWEGRDGGPLTSAAEWFSLAASDVRVREPARRLWHAGHLRAMARLIAVMGFVSRDRDTIAALNLIQVLAAFAESLADLREAQDRLAQARAARHAAGQLRTWTPPVGTPASPAIAATAGRYAPVSTLAERRSRNR
jgi:hypothetical protein